MKSAVILCGLLSGIATPSQAEVETEFTLGIEGVTGIRSDYVHRGFQLANSSLEFQLEGELVLSDRSSLHLGLSHLAESGSSFFETTGYLELSHQLGQKFTVGASMTYRDRDNSLLDGGFDLGLFSTYAINNDWRWRNSLNFDIGVDGIYFDTSLEWSTVISDDAFLAVESGLSAVTGYLNRDGVNDFHTRISLTYAISDQVSFTPFIGSSLQIEDSSASDVLYGGLWFQVIF